MQLLFELFPLMWFIPTSQTVTVFCSVVTLVQTVLWVFGCWMSCYHVYLSVSTDCLCTPRSSQPTEVKHEGSANSQPAREAGIKPQSRPPPERSLGPDVAGGQDETAAEICHQTLPVLPQHHELQLLHLSDCVCLSLWVYHLSVTFVTTTSHHPISSSRVREISHHFSEMDPVRQKWIYTFFMYPFLSGDRVAGKVF